MDKAAPGRWMGRHPLVCALIMAIAMGFGPAVSLTNNRSIAGGVLAVIAFVVGAGFGLLFSLIARNTLKEP